MKRRWDALHMRGLPKFSKVLCDRLGYYGQMAGVLRVPGRFLYGRYKMLGVSLYLGNGVPVLNLILELVTPVI
jgi:hypothetical protein